MVFRSFGSAYALSGLTLFTLLSSPIVQAAPASPARRIDGIVRDALGKPVADTQVLLQANDGRVIMRTQTDANGRYSFSPAAAGTFAIIAKHNGFQPGTAIVTLGADKPANADIVMAANEALKLQVAARRQPEPGRAAISARTGGSSYQFSSKDIRALPQGENTPLNQVLLQAPGVAQDSYGQVHVRGEHANLQYRINDIILPEGITGFGQTLDTRFANRVNLLAGTLPAEYGERTAGIVDIHTKSGAFNKGGNIDLYGGSHDTFQPSIQYGGSAGATNYYFSGSYLRNNLGIENPTPSANALHDRTEQGKLFAYASHLLSPTTRVSLMAGLAHSRFQLPNQAGLSPDFQLNAVSDYPSSQIDDNQTEKDRYGVIALQGSRAKSDYQIAAFSRYGQLQYDPDPIGDLLYNGVASQVYHSVFSNGLQGDATYHLDKKHAVRAGVYLDHQNAVSNNSSAVFPTDAQGNQASNQPFTIVDNNTLQTTLYAAYIQDSWKVRPKLTLQYGLRANRMTGYVNAGQLSPRVNALYQLSPATSVHIGYARYFTPPALESISSEDLTRFQNTTNAPASNESSPVLPERSNQYDIGISHRVTPAWQTGADVYYKDIRDMIDEGQFGQALIFAPFNYRKGRIYGLELSNTYRKGPVSAYLNAAIARSLATQVESGQFNFDPDERAYIDNNWVHTDHDQLLTLSGGLSYLWRKTTLSTNAVYGSGLRSGFANTSHLPGYVQANAAVTRPFQIPELGKVTGRLAVINLFDKSYALRDGSGIGVFAPQYGPRRAFYVGLNKAF